MKYDFKEIAPNTFKLFLKDTDIEFNVSKHIYERYNAGDMNYAARRNPRVQKPV